MNGKLFKTSRIVADLLSPKIAQMHFNDPTSCEYSIQTNENGDFQKILNLINFERIDILPNEIPYIHEILEILDNQSIQIYNKNPNVIISLDYIFDNIQIHENYEKYFFDYFKKDIDYIALNFYKINEHQLLILKSLKLNTLEMIFNHPNLHLESEDQIVSIVNELYLKDTKYSVLYDCIDFQNVTKNKITEFFDIFNIQDITTETWRSLSFMIRNSSIESKDFIQNDDENLHHHKYLNFIKYEKSLKFKGIINCLKNSYKNQINNGVKITSSSIRSDDDDNSPQKVIEFDDLNKSFASDDIPNSWICFDFGNKMINVKDYSIRSFDRSNNCGHLKSWVVEGSNDECDDKNWTVLDEQNDCNFLNGKNFVHTFHSKNENDEYYRFIRIKQTGPSWSGNNYLNINSVEFYGSLIL